MQSKTRNIQKLSLIFLSVSSLGIIVITNTEALAQTTPSTETESKKGIFKVIMTVGYL